jgi:hypothetical protein
MTYNPEETWVICSGLQITRAEIESVPCEDDETATVVITRNPGPVDITDYVTCSAEQAKNFGLSFIETKYAAAVNAFRPDIPGMAEAWLEGTKYRLDQVVEVKLSISGKVITI